MDLDFGLVVNINDPLYAQRVQVRVFGYYDDIPDDDLPWCQVTRSATDALTFNIGASSHNLVAGSQVLVGWLDKNYQQPIVIGQIPRIDDCDENRNLDVQRIYTKQGHTITISPSTIEIKDNKDNNLILDKDGITIKLPQDELKGKKGNITEEIEGSKEIKIDKDLNITVSNCNIKCSGETKIDASNVSIKNIRGPYQFCKIPACLFTGAPHISPSTEDSGNA